MNRRALLKGALAAVGALVAGPFVPRGAAAAPAALPAGGAMTLEPAFAHEFAGSVVWFATPAGFDSADGLAWAAPKSLGGALRAAKPGDTIYLGGTP